MGGGFYTDRPPYKATALQFTTDSDCRVRSLVVRSSNTVAKVDRSHSRPSVYNFDSLIEIVPVQRILLLDKFTFVGVAQLFR